MRSLSKRLERLEAEIARSTAAPPFPSFEEQFGAIERCMLPMLSAEDRELWLRSVESSHHDSDLWQRWNDAFNQARVEARQPWAISIADRWGAS